MLFVYSPTIEQFSCKSVPSGMGRNYPDMAHYLPNVNQAGHNLELGLFACRRLNSGSAFWKPLSEHPHFLALWASVVCPGRFLRSGASRPQLFPTARGTRVPCDKGAVSETSEPQHSRPGLRVCLSYYFYNLRSLFSCLDTQEAAVSP